MLVSANSSSSNMRATTFEKGQKSIFASSERIKLVAIFSGESWYLSAYSSQSTVHRASLFGGKIGGFVRCICNRRRSCWTGGGYLCAQKRASSHGRGPGHSSNRQGLRGRIDAGWSRRAGADRNRRGIFGWLRSGKC